MGPGSTPRRILYICNDGDYFRQHRMHLARRMAEEGFDVHIAAGGARIDAGKGIEFHALDVERFGFSLKRDVRLMGQIRALVEHLRPDVVHIITMKPAVVGALAFTLPGKPAYRPSTVVVTFPGLGRLFEGRSPAQLARQAIATRALRRLFDQPTSWATFENPADLAYLRDRGVVHPERTVLTSGTGLDLEAFEPVGARSSGPLRVLWASRLLRSKGIYEFLEAAELSRRNNLDTEYWIAGYPDLGVADALTQSEIDALSLNAAVRYCGHVRDMASLLSEVDVLVLPSRYNEGLPRILIEGAAARLALIGSNIPGVRQIIDNEKTGILLDTISGPAIMSSVARLASDRAYSHKLADAAYDKVWNGGFHERAVQDAFMTVYAP